MARRKRPTASRASGERLREEPAGSRHSRRGSRRPDSQLKVEGVMWKQEIKVLESAREEFKKELAVVLVWVMWEDVEEEEDGDGCWKDGDFFCRFLGGGEERLVEKKKRRLMVLLMPLMRKEGRWGWLEGE